MRSRQPSLVRPSYPRFDSAATCPERRGQVASPPKPGTGQFVRTGAGARSVRPAGRRGAAYALNRRRQPRAVPTTGGQVKFGPGDSVPGDRSSSMLGTGQVLPVRCGQVRRPGTGQAGTGQAWRNVPTRSSACCPPFRQLGGTCRASFASAVGHKPRTQPLLGRLMKHF